MSGEPYPGLLPDQANDRNLAPVQALLKVWDGAQGGGRNWQPVYLYREAFSGNFAARVHDADLQAALLGVLSPGKTVVLQQATVVAAGVWTFVLPQIDLTNYTDWFIFVYNYAAGAGGSATAAGTVVVSPLAAGIPNGSFGAFGAIAAGSSAWVNRSGVGAADLTQSPVSPFLGLRACVQGGANPTIVDAYACLMRR